MWESVRPLSGFVIPLIKFTTSLERKTLSLNPKYSITHPPTATQAHKGPHEAKPLCLLQSAEEQTQAQEEPER